MSLVAHLAGKGIDDLRVADVLFLSGDRQFQVTAHQPRDETSVVRRQALFEAERLGIDGSKLRVVAAAALGDVMKQCREVADLRSRQLLHDARRFGKLEVVARNSEAAQIADYEQRVRVYGVRMEQIVLHATDDAAECRDVAAEHAICVHASQLVRDAER